MEEQVDAIIAGGASVFVAGLGVPREVVDQCHRAGVLVMNMCGKVRHAEAAVDAGCDVVIAQGTEAGRSEEHTSELQSLMRISYAVFCLKQTTSKRTLIH